MAPATAAMVYVSVIPGHSTPCPANTPGVFGVPGFTDTDRVLAELSPQLFLAITIMLPLFPEAPVVTLILGEVVVTVILLLFQPLGNVQIYSAAFVTASTE